VIVSTSASYTFTASANRTLVANFAPTTYTIGTSLSPANSGSITGGGTVNCGSGVTVTATAASGYNFANWTENGVLVSTSASYGFTASANRTLVANFTCAPSLSSSNASYASSGGSSSVGVNAGGTCGWTANSGASWITVTSGSSGTGSGTVGYSVSANTGTTN